MRHKLKKWSSFQRYFTVLNQARDEIVKKRKIITVQKQFRWTKTEYSANVLDIDWMDFVISSKYLDLRCTHKIPMDFYTFRTYIYEHPDLSYWKAQFLPYRRWRGPIQNRHGLYYRQGVKFVQHGIQKKVVDEKQQAKADWRERKGFRKDQSKHRTWCKCGRFLKNQGARYRRRWERRLIQAGRYDDIYFHKDMFVSSWDAC